MFKHIYNMCAYIQANEIGRYKAKSHNLCQHYRCLWQNKSFGISYGHALKHKEFLSDVVVTIAMVDMFKKWKHKQGI